MDWTGYLVITPEVVRFELPEETYLAMTVTGISTVYSVDISFEHIFSAVH